MVSSPKNLLATPKVSLVNPFLFPTPFTPPLKPCDAQCLILPNWSLFSAPLSRVFYFFTFFELSPSSLGDDVLHHYLLSHLETAACECPTASQSCSISDICGARHVFLLLTPPHIAVSSYPPSPRLPPTPTSTFQLEY